MTIAAYTDIKSRRIKNIITYPLIVTGLMACFLLLGVDGLLRGIGFSLLAGVILAVLPGFKSGAGDIKLAAACGSWLGISGNMAVLSKFMASAVLLTFAATTIKIANEVGLKGIYLQAKLEFYQFVAVVLAFVEKVSHKPQTALDEIKSGTTALRSVAMKHEGVPMAPFIFLAFLLTIVP